MTVRPKRTKAPTNLYRVGEVCQILPKNNPALRGKRGCWCIITHVGEFICTVEAWDGEYTLRIDHLKPLNYLDSECQQMQRICDALRQAAKRLRIPRLRENENLKEADWAVLKYLGELKRPYLTDVEEKLLSVSKLNYPARRLRLIINLWVFKVTIKRVYISS
ncbi:hypothetical protein [Nostoc sp. FACHB-145]|uniref:hypothetical protein n=1 Tax=Nostoc sp. FACHB-145 TaxID=2692836 RepID=UPI001688145A|nr:hypothetical protein [Nostoc sp. FACHB-145]MBD2471721.1 hypothetical protein [Nostoc sp. FACHB-145]